MRRVGFIGTGNLAAFFVEGLRRANAAYDIIVSERNMAVSADLARRFGVRASASNQEIVDGCELVIVSVLPQQAEVVLSGLRYRAGQTVLSVMAGVSLGVLSAIVAPATAVVSMMPGLANAHGVGPSVLHPDEERARALLQELGPVHAFADEESFLTAAAMGAFSGLSVLMMRDAVNWFAANGLPQDTARRLVADTLLGNATMLRDTPLDINAVARGVVTPGGITEQGRKLLDEGRGWGEALDAIRARIAG